MIPTGSLLLLGRKTKMFPILNLLDDTLQPIPDTLHGIRAQNQPQRRIRAMPEFPDEMRCFHRARGLFVAEPEEHALCVCGGGGGCFVWLAGGFHQEMTVEGEGGGKVVFIVGSAVAVAAGVIVVGVGIRHETDDIIASHMSRFNKGGFDIKTIHLVEHTLHQPLDGIFRRTIRSQPGHPQRSRRRTENQVPPRAPLAEMRQRQLNHIQRAGEVGLELIPNIILVLVLAGADDAVAGAIGDHVDASEALDGALDDSLDGFADSYVAEEA